MKEKLAKLSGSKGISSSDFYEDPHKKKSGESRLEKIKDVSMDVLSKAKEGAKGVS